MQQQPVWRFEVRDDGVGYQADNSALEETHVGLRIMVERAQRIGALLEYISTPGVGTSVLLTLPVATLAPLITGASALSPAPALERVAA